MSMAAVTKIALARDCLTRAGDALAANAYDLSARKDARDQLRRCESFLKEARQAMAVVKSKEEQPEPEPEEPEHDQAENDNGENGAGKEVDHETE